MPAHRQVRLVSLVVAAVLLAACGSTVQDTSSVSGPGAGLADGSTGAGGLGGSELGTGSQITGEGSDLTGGAAGNGLPGGGGSSGGSVGGVGSSGTTGGAVASGAAPPGVTADKVYVGLIHDVNVGAANEAAGVGAITSGNDQANTRAIIKDINAHGGVGGRELVPVYAEFDSTSTQTLESQWAAVCQKFTQDNPRVFAVVGAGTEAYRQCMSKGGVTILSAGLPTIGQAELTRYPAFIEQGYPNVDRLAAYHVTPLVEQKYFTPWNAVTGQPAPTGKAKVGILTYNDRVFSSAVDGYLVPALKKLGYEPQVAKVAQITTYADYGAQGAAVKSAQLSFAANGVTHVIMFEANGGLGTLFLPTARAQGYYPRYGVNSASGSEALLEAGAADASQFNGAVGHGWLPSIDLPGNLNKLDGPYSNENRRYCIAVMNANGITFTSGNAEGIALNSCSNLYLLKAALDKTGSQVTQAAVIAAIESLGTSYQRAGSVGMEFRPGRHDPSNTAYHWRFYADCTCFHYEGPPRTIP